jgi:antitoxin HicB
MRPYPLILETADDGQVIAQARDVPLAIAVGRDEREAVALAADALASALRSYVEAGQPIPRPSRVKRGAPAVALPPLAAAKLALYQTLRETGLGPPALAAMLGCPVREVRELLDLDHHSRLDRLAAALTALGKRLVIQIRDAA